MNQTRLALWVALPVLAFNAFLLIEDLTGTDETPYWTHTLHSALAMIALPVVLASAFGWVGMMAAVRRGERARLQHCRLHRHREARKHAIASVLAAADTMTVVYQPVIDLREGEIIGYEALARFGDGRAPNLWFEQAHRLGMGVELELLAVGKALDSFADEHGRYIAVNVSPVTLLSGRVEEIISGLDIPVVIELTEHAAIEDHDAIASACGEVRRCGGRVAIDDVGNGNATLRNVLDLKPDIIKLDTSLICHLDEDPARHELAVSLVGFARSMGWAVVAEGIERDGELGACQEVGVHWGQGFLLGKPGDLPHGQGPVSTPVRSVN